MGPPTHLRTHLPQPGGPEEDTGERYNGEEGRGREEGGTSGLTVRY